MSEFKKRIADIKEIIEKYVLHPYMQKYIIPPTIDEDKIMILLSIVDELDISPFEKDTYVVAIMLMYIALETHDQVSVNDASNMKARQITVLAGDYYSGLYYKFLAQLNDASIIKVLSEGVKIINEQKVTIYKSDQKNVNSIMESVQLVEFALIEKLTSHYAVTHWNDSIIHFLLIKRLLKEKEQCKSLERSNVFHAIDRYVHSYMRSRTENATNSEFIKICDQYIQSSTELMMEGLKRIPKINPLLKDRMMKMIERQETMK